MLQKNNTQHYDQQKIIILKATVFILIYFVITIFIMSSRLLQSWNIECNGFAVMLTYIIDSVFIIPLLSAIFAGIIKTQVRYKIIYAFVLYIVLIVWAFALYPISSALTYFTIPLLFHLGPIANCAF